MLKSYLASLQTSLCSHLSLHSYEVWIRLCIHVFIYAITPYMLTCKLIFYFANVKIVKEFAHHF